MPRVGPETIRILLQSHDLKRWGEKMSCVADLDDDYIREMEDVVAIYKKPLDAAEPVIWLDKKPVPLRTEVRPRTPAISGQTAKRDGE